MGVLGLWRLLDPMGKPVPVETLEGKVLAIDVSIWIHQVLQGYQDRRGDSVPNAHLLGLFNRICKLLYFKIRPVFVFDGGVPMLKKNTIASRRKQKSIAVSKAQKLKNELMNNLIKHVVVQDVLDKKNPQEEGSPSKGTSKRLVKSSAVNNMYKLPEQPSTSKTQPGDFDFDYESDFDSVEELSPRKQSKWIGNIHSVNVGSHEFKSLPADVRYDILTDLKETRKQNSWGRIHEMPQVLNDFASFQMKRLLKRRLVQESLEVAEKEVGGKTLTLEELEKLLTEQGVNTSEHDDRAYRIASDSTTRVIFANDKSSQREKGVSNTSKASGSCVESNLDEAIISLRHDFTSCAASDNGASLLDNIHEYYLDGDWDYPDVELVKPKPQPKKSIRSNSTMETVMKYMLEYSSLPQEQILALIEQNKKDKPAKYLNSKREEVLKKSRKEKAKYTFIETKPYALSLNTNKKKYEKDLKDGSVPERTESVDSSSDSHLIETPNVSLSDKLTSLSHISQKIDKDVKVSNVQEIKSKSSDSDSDTDFITIEDVPIPKVAFTLKKEEKNNFEVIVRPDKILGEDLFADVFDTEPEKKPRIVGVENFEDKIKDKIEDILFNQKVKDYAHRNLNFQNFENNITSILSEQEGDKVEPNELKFSVNPDGFSVNTSDNFASQESIETFEITSSIEGSLSSNQAPNSLPLPISKEDVLLLKDKLEDEQRQLSVNIGKLERQAVDITEQMRSEAQELLRLFGIPYVVAPMEAEAQCAYLEQIGLTDGTITDDSDIWLFGGKCVYKNFFNSNKRVLQFRSCDIEHHFKLARQQLIQLALLVGSDYTSGLPGIGPVTAMEILAAFPSEEDDMFRGLINFSAWIKSGKIPGPGRTSLRNKLKNVEIEKGFPNQAVIQAYLNPMVDESNEKFTWGKPNLTLLSDYVRHKFGWTKLKFDEVINPVMKKLTGGSGQKSIAAYFKVQMLPKLIEKNLSKRVQSAIRRLGYEATEEVSEEEEKETKTKKSVVENLSQDRDINQNPRVNETISESRLLGNIIISLKGEDCLVNPQKAHSSEKDISISKSTEEYIPQREKDKANALKNKMRAIEVFSNSKKKTSRAKKTKRTPRKELKEADLSESSSSP